MGSISILIPWKLHVSFPAIVLMIFIANLNLYVIFYFIMKFVAKEKPTRSCRIFFILTLIHAAPACYFFVNQTKNINVEPAISKATNQPCLLLNFYDHHDLWHILSSFGLFFMLMFLLTIDDD